MSDFPGEPNIDLLEDVYGFITTHPELHNQHVWIDANACGTAACFAGWAVLRHGGTTDWLAGWEEMYLATARSGEDTVDLCTPEGDTVKAVHVGERARTVLGLTESEADNLFDGTNTLNDIRLTIDAIKNGEYR